MQNFFRKRWNTLENEKKGVEKGAALSGEGGPKEETGSRPPIRGEQIK